MCHHGWEPPTETAREPLAEEEADPSDGLDPSPEADPDEALDRPGEAPLVPPADD